MNIWHAIGWFAFGVLATTYLFLIMSFIIVFAVQQYFKEKEAHYKRMMEGKMPRELYDHDRTNVN